MYVRMWRLYLLMSRYSLMFQYDSSSWFKELGENTNFWEIWSWFWSKSEFEKLSKRQVLVTWTFTSKKSKCQYLTFNSTSQIPTSIMNPNKSRKKKKSNSTLKVWRVNLKVFNRISQNSPLMTPMNFLNKTISLKKKNSNTTSNDSNLSKFLMRS